MYRFLFLLMVASTSGSALYSSDTSQNAELVAEDQTPTGKFTTATEVKPILSATQGSWIAVREWQGQDLVYVSHIWAWRCGLVQLEIAVNDAPFDVWPLPACHTDTALPNGITDTDGSPYRAFDLQSVQHLKVRLTLDDLSVQEASFERKNVQLP